MEVSRLPEVQGYPTLIRQLMQNFIGNSHKFSRKMIPPLVKVMEKYCRAIPILMAEDDPDDRLLTEDALKEAHLAKKLFFVEDGEQLLDYLCNGGDYTAIEEVPHPGLILLDLNMPRKDGREALEEIKANPELRRIPVVVLTTSKAEEDKVRTYDLGVSGYITKPVKFESLVSIVKVLGKSWFEIVELPDNK